MRTLVTWLLLEVQNCAAYSNTECVLRVVWSFSQRNSSWIESSAGICVVYPRFRQFNVRRKHFTKIYLSFCSRKEPTVFISWEIDGETYSQRGDLFFPYLLPVARGCQRLHPLASSSETPVIGCMSHRSTMILCTLSKSDRVVLITRSPSGYTPVVPECSDRAAVY